MVKKMSDRDKNTWILDIQILSISTHLKLERAKINIMSR